MASADLLKVLDLFSGIGGFSVGLERTGGFETIAFCEIDPFCRRVLARHWGGLAAAGEPAELCGLIGQPQLNGQRVVLQGFHAEKGRWVVRLSSAEHEGKEIRVKPVNLQPLAAEQASNDG